MNETGNREESLFHAAMQLPTPEARAAFLREACAEDDQLRQQIEALLQAAHPTNDFLERATSNSVRIAELPQSGSTIALTVPIAEKPGHSIGHYKLLERIGEGGCGVVYMAEQTEPIRRRVALKVIKLGMDTISVVARFEAERQALALMDHPNIAKVLDAGATNNGRPYFVMELVKGIRITDYCDQNHLNTKERLNLFIQVCHAVQHAHQKGIIHRDLKPSNVLVTLLDGVPVPKVIDFGIAKATIQQTLADKSLFTPLQQFIGTPAYMSPEQADLSGLDIDTRSDIYSLGVLLYELLTGKLPFDPETLLKASLDEMRRIIREQEPPKPSTRFGIALAANPQSALGTPQFKEVRGDLDWIVMKCLEKDRARRYETASGLANDLERHLNHEPVEAAAPGTMYRMRKFVRRHRFGLAMVAALILLLVTGVVMSTWQAVRAAKAERQAQTVATFLKDMLRSVTPEETKGRDTTLVREVLDKAATRLEKELKGQPLIEAELRNTLGEVYQKLGEYSKAEPVFRRALETHERMLGKKHPDTLTSVNNLAALLQCKGDYAGAEPLYRRALEARERALGKEHPDTLGSMNGLAGLLYAKGDYAGAEPLYGLALEARERTLGKEHPDTLTSVNGLALLLSAKGDYAGAEPLYRRALDARERTLGKEHPDTLSSVNNLAALLQRKGDYAGAEPLYRRALEARERALGKEHPDTLMSMNGLAGLLDAKGDYAEAELLYRRALEAQERTLGKEHPGTLGSVNNLAGLLSVKGDYAGAEPLFRRALEAFERTLGKEHPDTLKIVNNLAALLFRKGDYTGAELLFRRALETFERTLGKEHPDTLMTVNNLAGLLYAKGDYAGAEPLFRRALEAQERTLGKEHPNTLGSVNNLAVLLEAKGDYPKAEPLLRRALEAQERTLGKEHPETLTSVNNLAILLESKGDYAGAESLLRRALEAGAHTLGKEHPVVAKSRNLLIEVLTKAGKPAEAEALRREAAKAGSKE
jgi:serine/threonine protein kinase/tetratricopeptide (TPR) repeat protein